MIASTEDYMTPPTIAKQLGVTCDRVLNWIHDRKLRAVDVSENGQPRWKISRSDLSAFMRSRYAAKLIKSRLIAAAMNN